MKHRGFTLIELLVVIAIIAILAAILFPVFAQAKQAAKKTQDLSNTKQTALGVLLYCGDTDDVFPVTAVYEWNASPEAGWATRIAPYLKSLPILRSPLDSGNDAGDNNFLGPWLSFASNSLTAWGTDNPGGGNNPIGLITARFPWQPYGSISATAPGKPAETILLSLRYNSDCYKAFPTWGDPKGVNRANFQPWPTMIYDDLTASPWSQGINGLIPRGTRSVAPANYPGNIYQENDPNSAGGTVSAHYGGQSTFAFADGHAKSMKPQSTNPDPANHPEQNMWDSRRG